VFKKIVVPLDGSDVAECALEGIKRVTGEGGEVVLLRVIEPPDNFVSAQISPDMLRKAEKQAASASTKYLDSVAERLQAMGVNVRTEVIWGRPAEGIVDYARGKKADLIILSTHGRSGLGRLAFGSVADKVMRTASLPVLIVRPMDQKC
jgi:nucleotide-binding universal stress UspA family protein